LDYSPFGNKKRGRSPHTTRVRNKIGLLILRVTIAVVLIAGFAGLGAGIGVYRGILTSSPDLDLAGLAPISHFAFDSGNSGGGTGSLTSFIMCAKTGEEREHLHAGVNSIVVSLSEVPQHLIYAFVAIEDERFFEHNGIDPQGASTITQQLIKNKLNRFDSDLTTKLQEQYLAIEFEKDLADPSMYGSKKAAKDYILEIYMNEINLGRGCYGVQAASWHYYGKDVSELTLAECATIAAITQNPYWLAPDIHPENNWRRAGLVLDKMLELGFITEREYYDAYGTEVYDNVIQGANLNTDGVDVVRSYFTDQIITEVSRDLMEKFNLTGKEASNWIYSAGLRIYTTQDTAMQAIVDKHMLDDDNFSDRDFEIDVVYRISTRNSITNKITNHEHKRTVKTVADAEAFTKQIQDQVLTSNDTILNDLTIMTPQPQACFVVMDPYNGHVKAISGGRGEKPVNRSFNRATDAVRGPGSQFKVLASYAPALDLGRISPASVIDDAPFVYDDGFSEPYRPRNWWGNTYEGLSTVRRGIYRSMNVVAVRNMFENSSIETSFGYLQNFGFTTLVEGEWRGNHFFTDKVASLPLGGLTDGVKAVELCAAYAAIANLGEYNRPVFYTKVLDHDGNVLLENRMEPRRVLRETTAYLLTDMMRDTLTVGTGTRCAFKNVKMPIAGKTGTTTDTKDLGFTGYTPYYAAAVWMGYDQQKRITDENRHRDLWRIIMEEIHEHLPEKEFKRPMGIATETVCRDSGKLATELCRRDPRGGRTRSDIYAPNTQPQDFCTVHQEIRVCTLSGQQAGFYCPETEMRVMVIRADRTDEDAAFLDGDYVLSGLGSECAYHGFNANFNPFGDMDNEFYGPPSLGDFQWGVPNPPPSTEVFTAPEAITQPAVRPEFDEPVPDDFWAGAGGW
jgi:penicillin-binding protein 1A